MFKSKTQKKREHNPNRLLHGVLEGLARSNKPDLAGVPKRFAEYTPLDLYQSFVPVKMDYKGQLCSGYVKRGWSLKVGLTGEFDFSFLLPGTGTGQLQPKGHVGYTRTKYSLALIQRFPQEFIYRATADGPNQGAIGLGQAGPEPENVSKWRVDRPLSFSTMLGRQTSTSVELGGSCQWGKTLFTVAGPGIVEDGTNDAGIGVGGDLTLSGEWENMYIVDPSPGWYESSLDTKLREDFLTYLGPKDARDLKREIFQWFRYCAEMDARWLPATRINNLAKSSIKQVARMPRGGDPTNHIDTLTQTFTYLPPLNLFNSPLEKLKDFGTKPKRDQLIKALKELAIALEYLRNNKDKDGRELPPRLKLVFLDRSRAMMDQQIHRIFSYIFELEQYDAPVPEANSNPTLPPIQPHKKGAVTPTSYQRTADAHLNYLRISTSKLKGEIRVGARAIMPIYAQIIVVGSMDVTVGVKGDYRKSTSRLQSFCYDRLMIPLVATQDTSLTYSRVGLNVKTTQQFASFFYDKTIDSAGYGIKTKLTMLNCIDYQSVVVYWPKLRLADGSEAKVCRGSGIRFGCSILLSRLKRLLGKPDAADSRKLLKGLMQALQVDRTTLLNFFRTMDIDKTISPTEVPPALLIESAFPFPDGMTLPINHVKDELTDLLSNQQVLDFAKKLKEDAKTGVAPKPETLRLRMRQADWMLANPNSTDFKLGFWAVDSIPAVIALKPIDEAGHEAIIDLYTQFVSNPEYNRNPVASQEKVVPPVALLHQ